MNKIKLIIVTVLSLILTSALFANPYAVNFNNLPLENEKFAALTDNFLNHYDDMRYWHQGISQESKNSCQALYKYLSSKKNKNKDEQILEAVVYRCLYNCDLAEKSKVTAYFEKLIKNYPDCPEYYWIYGNYLSQVRPSVKESNLMSKYITLNNGNINIWFLEDYAFCCATNGKYFTAIDAIKTLAEFVGGDATKSNIYSFCMNKIKTTDPEAKYDFLEAFNWYKSENHEGLISTMYGIFIPFKFDRAAKIMSGPDGKTPAIFSFESPEIKTKNGKVFYSTCMTFYNYDADESLITSPIIKDESQIVKTENRTINGKDFKLVYYENPEVYNDDIRKGSKGIIAIVKLPYVENRELALEFPVIGSIADLYPDTNQIPAFYDEYTRVPATVTIGIVLDSCNTIYEQSEKEFNEFLESLMLN